MAGHLERPPYKRNWRILAIICMMAVTCCLLATVLNLSMTSRDATKRDFIEYWAAAQQLHRAANPYDVDAVLVLERSAGLDRDRPLISWSPPVLFSLLLPLGLFDPKTGFIVWTLILLACLSLSLGILWSLHARPNSRLHLLGYLFAPALCCLNAGQLGIFLLLGIVIFLRYHSSRPFLAGMALFPCVFKPHLFVPFVFVLLLWTLYQKAYRIVFGFALIVLAGSTLPLCFDTHVWAQYAHMMHTARALQMYAPTLSAVLRSLINRDATWPQFLPEIAGVGWSLWYFRTRRLHWRWDNQGLLLLLVSALCAPYAFFTDESMLLPAVLAGLYKVIDSRRSTIPLMLIAGIALLESFKVQLYSLYFLWTIPAWLGWYIYATWGTSTATSKTGKKAAPEPLTHVLISDEESAPCLLK